MNYARLLEQVLVQLSADDASIRVEQHVQVLAETRRVVVDDRLGVAKRLQQRVHLQYLLLETLCRRLVVVRQMR